MSRLQLPIVLTPTRAELGSRCHRRHFLADILERGRYHSPSLAFGTVFHAGAAEWWRSASHADAERVLRVMHSGLSGSMTEKTTEQLATGMLASYVNDATLAGPFQSMGPWQVVSIEDRLEMPLGRHRLSFQTDRVLFNKDRGHLVVVDTKTAQRLDPRWERQWEMSLQMKLYRRAMQRVYDMPLLDVVIEGVLKDIPSRVRYYTCPEWDDATLDEAERQFIRVADEDRRLIESDAGIPIDVSVAEEIAVNQTATNYHDCFSYNVECPFRRLCIAEPAQRAAILRGEYLDIPSEY